MPDRVEVFDITCPGSTPSTAPVETVLVMNPGIVRVITIIIPDGHAGLTGIALGYGHQPVIPRTQGKFISSNDEFVRLETTGYPAGVGWSAFTCNNDILDHVWEVILELDEIPVGSNTQTPIPLTPVDILAGGQ